MTRPARSPTPKVRALLLKSTGSLERNGRCNDVVPVMVLLSLGFRPQPSKRDEVLSAVDEAVARMRHLPGCSRGRLFADTEDPESFTLISEWQSLDDADGFFGSKEFQMLRGMRMLLRDEPVVVLDDVRTRLTRLVQE